MTAPGRGRDSEWLWLPNLGAEEGPDWPRLSTLPAVAATTQLWRAIFPASNRPIGPVDPGPECWPEAFGSRTETAAFRWLSARPGVYPWFGDAPAAERIRALGHAPVGPDPVITRAVHDKGFACEHASALGYEAPTLRGLASVLDPEMLTDSDSAVARIEAALASWPDWTGGRFILKPRLGGSGRGRYAGRRDRLDPVAIGRTLPRFVERGGAVLEPWLDRAADLSVSLFIDEPHSTESPGVTLLGSLEQWLTPSGVPIGHVGEIDSRGRISSGHRRDEAAREAAVAIAHAARAAGYYGPCGVDSLVFRVPDESGESSERLRPVVEFNARFTLGIVAIGLMRRLLSRLRRSHGLTPGERRAFVFALAPPAGHPDWPSAAIAVGDDARAFDFAGDAARPGAGVLIARDREALAPLLARSPEEPSR
jgi:hypothetical protein